MYGGTDGEGEPLYGKALTQDDELERPYVCATAAEVLLTTTTAVE